MVATLQDGSGCDQVPVDSDQTALIGTTMDATLIVELV
jgi:hypothetical protein